jgi:hypothetical protein
MRASIFLTAWLATIGAGGVACAEIELGTGFNIEWDRSANPSGSPSITLPMLYSGTGDALITSFNVGFYFLGGTTGSLAIGPTIEFPAQNPIFPDFATATPVVSMPSPGITSLNGENSEFENVMLTGTANALVFNVSSPNNDAMGVFQLWASSSFSNYFTTTEFDGFPFGNAENGDLLLGTISVVPEPASALLACLAAAGVSCYGLLGKSVRRRRASRAN